VAEQKKNKKPSASEQIQGIKKETIQIKITENGQTKIIKI
jgi:hypothetical protein